MRPALIQFEKKLVIEGDSSSPELNQIVVDAFDLAQFHAESYRAKNWNFFEKHQQAIVKSVNDEITSSATKYFQGLKGVIPSDVVEVNSFFKAVSVSGEVTEFELMERTMKIELTLKSQPFTILDSLHDTMLLIEGNHLRSLKQGAVLSNKKIHEYKLKEGLEITSYQSESPYINNTVEI